MGIFEHHELSTLVIIIETPYYAEYGYALACAIKEIMYVIAVLFHYVVGLIAIVAWPTHPRTPT
jgi:hypothetical protein